MKDFSKTVRGHVLAEQDARGLDPAAFHADPATHGRLQLLPWDSRVAHRRAGWSCKMTRSPACDMDGYENAVKLRDRYPLVSQLLSAFVSPCPPTGAGK